MALGRGALNVVYKTKNKGKGMVQSGTKSYSAKQAVKGKDIGKRGKMFSKIEKAADKKYGKGHGAKVAGAILKKLRSK